MIKKIYKIFKTLIDNWEYIDTSIQRIKFEKECNDMKKLSSYEIMQTMDSYKMIDHKAFKPFLCSVFSTEDTRKRKKKIFSDREYLSNLGIIINNRHDYEEVVKKYNLLICNNIDEIEQLERALVKAMEIKGLEDYKKMMRGE